MLINFSLWRHRSPQNTQLWELYHILIRPLLRIRASLSLYLYHPEDSTPSEQIEGHLPEKSIQDVFDNPGKPGPEGVGMQVA
jgi:hypothetical protein